MSLYTFINDASRRSVASGLNKIRTDYFINREFLPNTNNLKVNCVKAVENRFNATIPNPLPFNSDDAKGYLATSAILHSFDGWNYLSRSINSLIDGDGFAGIHLAYYAELRAAMTFLASEGVGIFDHHHFCINQQDQIVGSPNLRKDNGTHKFVWKALNEWIQNVNKSTHLLNCFYHNGYSFSDWIRFIPRANNVSVISQITQEWLKEWSFDIRNYTNDRTGRNTFSYRPTRLKDLSRTDLQAKLNELIGFWRLLEPENSSRFTLLDKHLFKILFKRIYAQLVRNGSQLTQLQILDQMFQNAGRTMDIQLRNIVSLPDDHSIIQLAKNNVINTQTGYAEPLSIIARAILMLRISSGTVSNLFTNTRTNRNELDFYFELEGTELGFYDQNSIPQNFTSLWTIINDTILEIEDWINTPPPTINLKAFYEEQLEYKLYFPQFNRAAFWGTGF